MFSKKIARIHPPLKSVVISLGNQTPPVLDDSQIVYNLRVSSNFFLLQTKLKNISGFKTMQNTFMAANPSGANPSVANLKRRNSI